MTPIVLCAQEQVEGLVLDRESKDRLGAVLIYNLKSKERVFNNHRGEFRIKANSSDTLVFLKEGYFSDTLITQNRKIIVHSMKKDFTKIEPVDVLGRQSPEKLREQAFKDYKDAYRLANGGSLLTTGPEGRAGVNLNMLYGLVSKRAKMARRFTNYLDLVYENNVIDARFTPDLITKTVGLEGQRLQNFMIRYRPTYQFVTRASYFEIIQYIKNKYNMFKILPDLRPLPELPKVDFDVHEKNVSDEE